MLFQRINSGTAISSKVVVEQWIDISKKPRIGIVMQVEFIQGFELLAEPKSSMARSKERRMA